jgi:exportin-7
MDRGYHQQRYGQETRQKLDQAMLGFFQNFQKVYIGEQVMHSSFVYGKLSERLPGITDHNGVLQLMLNKIAINLQQYGESEALVHATLCLFQVGAGVACEVFCKCLGL